ncbi:MAG: hypothetical protein WB760_10320 [Xanthobacteraceae bacterium]
MLGIVSDIAGRIESSTSPLWIAVGSASFLVTVIFVLVLRRSRTGRWPAVERVALIGLGAVLTGSLTWACLDGFAMRSEHNVFEMRAQQLTAQAITTGSPLACLDPLAGDAVEGACEKAVFASPESVAAATSYVAAQFVLLADMADYRKHGGADIDRALLPLRRALEADPFGFLAHVLVVRDGCTNGNCSALAVLGDPSHVRTNLIAQTFDHFVDHYREFWGKAPDAPVAAVTDAPTAASAEAGAAGKHKVVVNIDFPSAASIPPISIMNPEPKGPATPHAAGAPANTEARARTGKPGLLPGADGPKVDPVWTPAPAQAAQ